jgi:hypothetical protein
MKASLEKACVGVAPDSKAEIPDFLTPEKTLQILEKIMKSSALRIHQAFQDLKNQGKIRFLMTIYIHLFYFYICNNFLF